MKRPGIKSILFLLLGLAFLNMALFAQPLGLDREAGWGRIRIGTLLLGITIILSYVFYSRYREAILRGVLGIRAYLENHPTTSQALRHPGITRLSYFWNHYRFTLPAMVFVILTYIWFVSAGTWTTWISPTRYYANLARGFQQGHLYLPSQPDPALLQLSDPYDPFGRGEVEVPIDITFYGGKYYLYWGPVPAILLLAIQSILHGRVGDLFLVFGFVCGIFLSQFFLMLTLWDHFFRALPKWLLFLSILLVGLAGPVPFMLDHVNSARIYEAAITGGQFFLMSGLLIVISTSNELPNRGRLALGSTLWALAIATRFTLIVPIGLMTLMIAFMTLRSDNSAFNKITKLIHLGLPLALGAACLGWYNWARFGSVTETGHYYQLGGTHFQKYYSILFHPAYIWRNLYNYVLHPFQINTQFPFVHPTYGNSEAIFTYNSLPSIYSAQVITGIIFTAPFIVLAIIPPTLAVYDHFRNLRSKGFAVEGSSRPAALHTITLLLGTASLSSFVALLFFYWAGMRYLEDFIPALMVLSVIGFWQGFQILTRHPKRKKPYAVLGIVLASASVLISLLVALSVNNARFMMIRFFGLP